MPIAWKPLLLPAFLALPTLVAADWPALAPEVWAIKEDPAKGIKDAVILEDRTILKNTYVERIRRVRILSEAGRKAVELDAFSEDCYDFNGRTVYPDGKVLKFEKKQDFKMETTEVGDYSRKRTVVIPPGVNGNCVVEMRWFESTAQAYKGHAPLPKRMGYHAQFSFGGEYLTLLEEVEIPMLFRWSYSSISGRTQKLDIIERSGCRVISARNLPVFEQPPFSLGVSLDRPSLSIYYQPELLLRRIKDGEKAYWDGVGIVVWKDDFEYEVRKGKHYEALRTKLLQGLQPTELQASACKLLIALEKEIVNTNHLTREEIAKFPKDQKIPKSKDLGSICESKIANGWGMMVLCYHLLKDGGYNPKVAFLADRDVRLFRPSMLNPWQATYGVLVVEEPGKDTLFLDPIQRFAAPGLIHPDFQGVNGLLVDPKNQWSTQPFQVPIQSSSANKKDFRFTLEIGEEEDHFKVDAQFLGFPEFAERRRYDQDDQPERNRKLKERFEKQIQGAVIQRAEVQNADSSVANVAWVVEGQVERESSRQCYIFPFPGLRLPIAIPDLMPKDRNLPIVMPYLQIQSARSTIKIPKGYRVQASQPSEQKNVFGSVQWAAEVQTKGEESQAVVTMTVSLDKMFATPSAYEDLKTYLGWISDSFKRTLILEKI